MNLLGSRAFLVEVTGLGGIGKTALAIEVAKTAFEQRRFAHIIWVSAKYQPITLESFLRQVLSELYGPNGRDLAGGEGVAIVRRELARRNTLIVIDNYEEVSDQRLTTFFQDLPDPSKALVTARHASLKSASPFPLGGLPRNDVLALIRAEANRLGLGDAEGLDHSNMDRLHAVSHGVPFVVKWFLGQIKAGQAWEVLLSGIEGENPAAEEVYDYIFRRTFRDVSPELLRVLVVCAFHRNPVSFEDLLAAMGALSPDLLSRSIAALVDQSLVDVQVDQSSQRIRYAVHPLTRTYVQYLVNERGELQELVARFFERVLERAVEDGERRSPGYHFLTDNIATVLSAAEHLERALDWQKIILLRNAISRFLWVRGHWTHRISLGERALKAARLIGDRAAQAAILMDDLGWTTYSLRHDEERALMFLLESQEICDGLVDPFGQTKVRRHLAAIARNRGDLVKAAEFYSAAAGFVPRIQNEGARDEMDAGLRVSMGKLAAEQGDLKRAIDYLDRAIALYEKNKDQLRLVRAMNSKAAALVGEGRLAEAQELLKRVIEQARVLGRIDQLASAEELLAEVFKRAGRRTQAREAAWDALVHYTSLGDEKSQRRLKDRWGFSELAVRS